MYIGYTRIAKFQTEEELDVQKTAIVKFGCHDTNIYTEKTTREDERFELMLAVNALRKGDKLVIMRLSSLGYDLLEIGRILEKIEQKSAHLVILDMGGAVLDSSTKLGSSMIKALNAAVLLSAEEMRERKLEDLATTRRNYAKALS
ncbi:MAG: recombinase family protein [Paracoccaceae bacterium]|tara:strand:+ start:450 stop:887 length:438 start_codon:yes stop_codon:yes gene_type:complete